MPGSVSDAYDPEWGTAENAESIRCALLEVYGYVTGVLDGKPPLPILELVRPDSVPTRFVKAYLTERQWRLIRFALERAGESI